MGLEALSRGASHLTLVESDRRALALIAQNVARCGAEEACVIIRGSFLTALGPAAGRFDLVLLDPPYDTDDYDRALMLADTLVADDGRVVLEHSARRVIPLTAGRLHRTRVVTAGDSALSFFAVATAAPSTP